MDARRFRFGPGHVHVQQKQAALRSGYDASAQHARLVGTLCPSVVARYAQRGEPPLFELHRTSRTRPTKSPTPKPSTAAPTPSSSPSSRPARRGMLLTRVAANEADCARSVYATLFSIPSKR